MAYYDNVWSRAQRQYVDAQMMANPQYAVLCSQYLAKLKERHYRQAYVDAIMQKWVSGREDWDIYHAAAFMDIHAALCTGKVLATTIEIGKMPRADAHVEGNQEILDVLAKANITSTGGKLETVRFNGRFKGGSHNGSDGMLKWFGLVRFSSKTSGKSAEIYNGMLPLEVGMTDPAITISHLSQDGGLARWPYGSTRIWLFYTVDARAWNAPLPHVLHPEKYAFRPFQVRKPEPIKPEVKRVQVAEVPQLVAAPAVQLRLL